MRIFSNSLPKSANSLAWRFFLSLYVTTLATFILYNFSPLQIKLVNLTFFIIVFYFTHAVELMRLTYINEIRIDTDNKLISFYCYKPRAGKKEYHRTFADVKVEIVEYLWPKNARRPKIYFFRKEPGHFYVSARKDNFSHDVMNEIAATLKQLTSPLKRSV
jgi:hypothetical protein